MIYLFNNDKTLYTDHPIISEDKILSMPERRQINGLWTVSAELLVEGIYEHVNNSEFIGFYDNDDRFQLYKIIDLQVNNDLFIVDAVYLFHDEAYSGEVIRDRRFRNRQADVAAIAAFEPIGWELDGFDFTDERTTNFFYISPLEALARIEEVWGVEFNFWLTFDGQKILGKYYEVRKQIGARSNIIYEYNENISNVTHTQSRQDIVTAILPRGRGEEIEEGVFGRSIQIDDVVWSKANGDPLDKPAGQDYLELPEMTALWGYDGVKPRIRKVDFSNEEDPEQLIALAHEWLLDNSVPKSVFKLQVDDGRSHDLGDIVGVSYKEIGLTSYTRVFEVERDHRTGRVIVEFGDVELKSDRRISAIRSDIDRIESNNSRVVELQEQFNDAFDRKVRDMEQHYDQALIDAHAEIEALDEKMATEIATEIANFETEFNAEVQAAKDLAAQQIEDTEQRINTTIDTARTEMENEFNAEVERIEQEALAEYDRISGEITSSIGQARSEIEQDYNQAVISAREYAEQQAEQHANVVDSKLETMRGVHADLIQQNRDNIANVNDFIGNQTDNLSGILQTLEHDFNQKIARETWHYNLLRGTQFDEDFWTVGASAHGAILDDEPINYWLHDQNTHTGASPYIQTSQSIELTEGVKYRLSFDVKTYGMRLFSHTFLITDDGSPNLSIAGALMTAGNIHNVVLGSEWRRIWVEFIPERDATGFIRIGTTIANNSLGRRTFRVRRPYLTESENIQWLYHLDDNMQNLEEVTMRVSELETGFETLITRTEYDNKTDQIEGTIRIIEDTVDGYSSLIQNHEDWITTNGASISHTVDGFDSKVWLSDIHNPNIIPHSAVNKREEQLQWYRDLTNVTGVSYGEWFQVTHSTSPNNYLAVHSPEFSTISGETYTLSFESWENGNDSSNTSGDMNYVFLTYRDSSNQSIWAGLNRNQIGTINGTVIYRNEVTFVANATSDTARMLIGTRVVETGQHSTFRFRRPKLELGSRATPYYTAFSGLTQRVDEISLLTQEIDGNVVKQSDITVSPSSVRIGSTEILGDDVLSSVLNVSPNAIDMITQKMRLSGDLYVDGDITSLAISAVEGNFADLIVANLETNKLRARHINANAIGAEHLWIDNALIDKLSASSIFTDMLTAKTISAVEGNFAELIVANLETNRLRARHINANAIGAEHLWVDNALIDKLSASTIFTNMLTANAVDAIEGNFARLFASEISTVDLNASNITTGTLSSARLQVNNALINRLIANSILTGEIRSQSLTAVRADIGDLRTRILTSDVIKSDHISSSNAMIDKLFATNALISRLTSKSAFISNVKAIEIDVEKITGNTSTFVQSNWNAINSNLEVTGARLRYTHSDGSYTQMSAAGLRKFDNNSWYTTHYLMDNINVTVNTGGGTGVQWVQLPDVYKGKNFKIFLSATDIYGAVEEGDYYFNHLTLKRFVLIKSPDHNIDYANARVPIRGYAHYVDDRDKSRDSLFYHLQGVLTVIY